MHAGTIRIQRRHHRSASHMIFKGPFFVTFLITSSEKPTKALTEVSVSKQAKNKHYSIHARANVQQADVGSSA